MKTKNCFKLRRLGKDHILTPEATARVNFNKMIVLNESAAFLWESVKGKDAFTVDDLADALVGQYGIDRSQAAADAANICEGWREAGLIDD